MPVDWHGKGGVVSEGFEPENLDTSKEFVLELVEMEYNENVTVTFQGDSRVVDRFKTVWQVEGHQTKVWQWFNLPVGFLGGAGVNDRSNVVLFAKRAGHPVEKGKAFLLDQHFVEHMRIRCYLEKQKEGNFYKMDLNTVTPFQQAPLEPSPAQADALVWKKLISLYNNVDEAQAAYKESGGDMTKFYLLWNQVQAEKAGPPVRKNGPIIDAEKGTVHS